MESCNISALILFTITIRLINAHDSCTSPRGTSGSCVPIYKCPELMALLLYRNRGPFLTKVLVDSQCGQEGRDPKVCCETRPPSSCFTPEGAPGTCLGLADCPSLETLVKTTPNRPETRKKLLRSLCGFHGGASKFCCPRGIRAVDMPEELCGLEEPSERIVGGSEAGLMQYPWMALISYRLLDGSSQFKCGGSLVNRRYVVTAAHCVVSESIGSFNPESVRLGEYDRSHDGPDCVNTITGLECTDEPLDIPIKYISAHPEYEDFTKRNDIAVITLSKDVKYTEFIRPICLPKQGYTSVIKRRPRLIVAGWGVTETGFESNVKQHIALPFVDLAECRKNYTLTDFPAEIWEKQLCAGGKQGKDACRGDSGGPLMHRSSGKYVLAGVISAGAKVCGSDGIPGIYTNIEQYLDWISDQMWL